MTKAAVLIEPGKPLVIEDVVVDKPGPHEVRIRTAACGLCHSDLHFIDGAYPHPLPAIPGHEAAGIVEAVGSEVRTVKPGDAVVTCLSAFCGHCEFCVSGRMSLCLGGDTRRKSPPPLAPLATLVPLRVAVSTRSATLRPPNGGGGSLVPRSRSLRSLALGERYFYLCGVPLARLRFFCSFRISSQITPLKNKSFSGAAPYCCCLAACGGLSSR